MAVNERDFWELSKTVGVMEHRLETIEGKLEDLNWLEDVGAGGEGTATEFATDMLSMVKLIKEAAPVLKAGMRNLADELEKDAESDKSETKPAIEAEAQAVGA